MKKTFWLILSIVVLIVSSCSNDEEPSTSDQDAPTADLSLIVNNFSSRQSINRSTTGPTPLDIATHRLLLQWNSFIIAEMMRDNPEFRDDVLNALDPITNSVTMNEIIDFSSDNPLLEKYIVYADTSQFWWSYCKPDTSLPWPPTLPKSAIHFNNLRIGHSLAYRLLEHTIEIYIPNTDFSEGDILAVGHPLNDSNVNDGYIIHENPIETGNDCGSVLFASEKTIDDSTLDENKLIIVSRPFQIERLTEVYDYLDFDLQQFLAL